MARDDPTKQEVVRQYVLYTTLAVGVGYVLFLFTRNIG
jgi:hypothetical protein